MSCVARIPRCCGRPEAVALIRPLYWELPYAAGSALIREKKKRQNNAEGRTWSWWVLEDPEQSWPGGGVSGTTGGKAARSGQRVGSAAYLVPSAWLPSPTLPLPV